MNEDNVLAHYETTGSEILEQVPNLDVFIAGMGTGGTVMGAGRRLKEYNPKIKVVGIEAYPNSNIQGFKNFSEGYVPPIIDFGLLDERVCVRDEDAFETAREIARREGLFVGISSGATMYEAMRQAAMMEEGTVVAIFADDGSKDLSTGLFG